MATRKLIQISKKGKPSEVPALIVQGRNVVLTGRWFTSAAIHDEEWLTGETLQDPDQFVAALRTHRPRIDLFSFAYTQPDTPVRHDYHLEWDNVAVISTESYEQWWNGLSQDSRRNVRLAQKRGVRVEEAPFDDAFVRGIKGIYDETPVRQGRKFWHYGKDVEVVRHDNGTFLDRSVFIGAFLGEELIGFIKLVFVGKTARIMQILAKNAHFDKKPANAMIAKAVEICSRRGTLYLSYCRYIYGKKGHTSITEFKRRAGFQELRFPRYYVPLTWKGRVAIYAGFHLGWKHLIPASMLNMLLAIRSRIYERIHSEAEYSITGTPTPNLDKGPVSMV